MNRINVYKLIDEAILNSFRALSGGGGGVSDATLSLWVESLNCNLGLVCLTKDENNKPTIAGFNCTTICTVNDENGMDVGIYLKIVDFYKINQNNHFRKELVRYGSHSIMSRRKETLLIN